MKRVILIISLSAVFSANAQRSEFERKLNTTIEEIFKKKAVTNSNYDIENSGQKGISFTGLVPDTVFEKIVYADYNKLGLISKALPQTSLLFDVTKKELNVNYSGFIGKASMLNNYPFSYNTGVTLDFNDETQKSAFITGGKLVPNIKFTVGARFFLQALANYKNDDKDALEKKIENLVNGLPSLSFYNLQVISDTKCNCTDTSKADYKSFYCQTVRAIPADTCITKSRERYTAFIQAQLGAQIQQFFLKAPFTKKIYRWIGVDIDYARPEINTLNRQNTIDTRLNTKIYNNTGVNFNYNILNVYKNVSQYFVYSLKYQHADNSANLSSIDANYNRLIETVGTTTYFESKTKKAYDTTLLKDSRFITLGFDYFYFFKKAIGFSGGIKLTYDDNDNTRRKIDFGILFPVVKKDKTKTVLTIYYSLTSTSKNILSGRYPGELGFKIGVPIDMFTYAGDK